LVGGAFPFTAKQRKQLCVRVVLSRQLPGRAHCLPQWRRAVKQPEGNRRWGVTACLECTHWTLLVQVLQQQFDVTS